MAVVQIHCTLQRPWKAERIARRGVELNEYPYESVQQVFVWGAVCWVEFPNIRGISGSVDEENFKRFGCGSGAYVGTEVIEGYGCM